MGECPSKNVKVENFYILYCDHFYCEHLEDTVSKSTHFMNTIVRDREGEEE